MFHESDPDALDLMQLRQKICTPPCVRALVLSCTLQVYTRFCVVYHFLSILHLWLDTGINMRRPMQSTYVNLITTMRQRQACVHVRLSKAEMLVSADHHVGLHAY